jgi:hypothetical protein
VEEPPVVEEETPFDTGGPCTKNEAWDDVNEMKRSEVTDSELAKVWMAQIELVAPGAEQKNLNDDDWGAVRASVLDLTT